jgi:hypothetical protein
MERILFFLFCLVSFCRVNTQPSQTEAEAMQRKLQKMMDSIRNDPKVRKYLNSSNSTSGMTPVSNPSLNQYDDKNFDKLKLPPRNSARINSISKKSFSLKVLSSYLTDLHTLLTKKLPPDAVSSANSIASGEKLIAIGSQYFTKDLPRYVPQFMILYGRWTDDPVSLLFKKEFEENFPLGKLKAMIDK